jgi:hypothetical protein
VSDQESDWPHDEPNAYINGQIWQEMQDAANDPDDDDPDDGGN